MTVLKSNLTESFNSSPSTKQNSDPHNSPSTIPNPYGPGPSASLVNIADHLSSSPKNKVALRKRKRSRHPLREFRIKRGYTLEELAELTRLSPSYLSRLESGTRRLNADVLHRLALVLSCHPGDLLMHDSPSRFMGASAVVGEQTGLSTVPQDLPLYEIRAEGHRHIIDFENSSEWLPRPPELLGIAGSFSFHVKDDSLGQRYRKGDHVFVHPTKALSPNCSILVITRSDQALVGQFLQWKSEQNNNVADSLVIRLIERIGNEDCFKDISISRANIKATYRIIGLMEAV
jgi:transcriptional regulator with XRE-family HTH domain